MVVSKKIVAALSLLVASSVANANLIVNGGFEDNQINENSWSWFVASDVNGWEGSNIEIWNSYGKREAFEGDNFAELNAHGNKGKQFSIFQTIDTVAGTNYDLSFAYQARSKSNESFAVDVFSGNTNLLSVLLDDHTKGSWSEFLADFTATETKTVVSFTTITPKTGTVGNFLDAVAVEANELQTSEVSAPGAIALLAIGLAFIARRRLV